MQTILSFGKLALLLSIGFTILLLTQRKKIILLDIIFLGFCSCTYEWLTNTTIRFSLPFMNLGITDILSIYLLIAMCITKTNRMPQGIRKPWFVLVAVFLFGAIRGFVNNNYVLVIEDIRRLIFSFIVPIGCIAVLPFSLTDDDVKKRIKNYARITICFCIICWVLDLIGIHVSRAQSDAGTTMRVLRAEQVQALGLLALEMAFVDLSSRNHKLGKNTIALMAVIILLQHRSVWVSFFVGFIYLLVIGKIANIDFRKLLHSKKFLTQVFLGVLLVSFLVYFMKDSDLTQKLLLGLQGIRGGDGTTLAYREQLWIGHLSNLSPIEWLIGKPFGSGYFVQLASYSRDLTPHSAFVQTIIRCGLVGLAAVVSFYFCVLKKARQYRLGYIEAGCVMMLVFYYAYTYHFYASAVIGLFLATLKREIMYDNIDREG